MPEKVDLPMFWGLDANSQDSMDALDWLTGTEAGKLLQAKNDDNLTKLEEIDKFYYNTAESLLLLHLQESKPTLMGFHHAFSLVSSRAFLVDAYHGLSMVPIADVFNHGADNQVHLESDYNVCPECGSLQECPHDKDDLTDVEHKLASSENQEDNLDTSLLMVTNAGIPPDTEVFNTYGETLSNSQLLNQYGFMLETNDNMRLSWTMYNVVQELYTDLFLIERLPTTERRNIVTYMFQVLTALEVEEVEKLLSTQSDLVYYEDTKEEHFFVKYEGLSHPLWALLFVLSLIRYRQSNKNFDVDPAALALDVLKLQTTLEALEGDDEGQIYENDPVFNKSGKADKAAVELLRGMSNLSVALCDHRGRNSGKPGSFDYDLFKLLDELPKGNTRTRLAVSLVITERSILKNCQAGWQSMAKRISSTLPGLS
ncbi:Ribosomal lysine N-methyltransferase 3 [Psilocybe cubensis]|uniref:Ribosomal lysine N-methyltransferase 3 n=2 Tax=Psilocybe cubensis TaxID=181762 RepID=A0ACB8HDB0_PSICU|nr:Ribosomal lysine N-methyltransferase 3 [Psilocybe cubensis]KAH9485669.1 Ribosomal lysine N-methyltransferase 3 [Psilocybe cubensis]